MGVSGATTAASDADSSADGSRQSQVLSAYGADVEYRNT
jgi:hypothetical protein